MRASRLGVILLVLLLPGASASAQDDAPTVQNPDFSRHSLLRLLAQQERSNPEQRIRFRVGAVEFTALGTQWRFLYLPIMMPFSGSRFGVTRDWPDPLLLSRTPVAIPPRLWRERRAIEKELKRIGKTSAKVKVRTE